MIPIADPGMDAFSVIAEIPDATWSVAIAAKTVFRIYQEVLKTVPPVADVKLVAEEYQHKTFTLSCDVYTDAQAVVDAAVDMSLMVFHASAGYTTRQTLFKRVAKSATFERMPAGFRLGNQREYATTRTSLYEAYHTASHLLSLIYEQSVTNTCKTSAEFYDHLESLWSDAWCETNGTKLRDALRTLTQAAREV